jgi:Arc/MetJ family transcription regulator
MIGKISREPMLHFLLAAFCIAGWMHLQSADQRPRIQVDDALIAELVASYESDPRVTPGSANVEQLVAEYVREELLYQEALKYEAYQQAQVRRTLIREMSRQLEPVIAEPSEEDLQAYYANHAERYRSPPSIAFEHVSWAPGATDVPEDMLARLNAGASPQGLGQKIRLANPIPLTFLPNLQKNLGAAAAEQIFACPADSWAGPIQSPLGIHFIRVLRKNSTGERSFEQIRSTVKSHWIRTQIETKMEAVLAEISQDYQVDVPAAYQTVLP